MAVDSFHLVFECSSPQTVLLILINFVNPNPPMSSMLCDFSQTDLPIHWSREDGTSCLIFLINSTHLISNCLGFTSVRCIISG